MSSSGDRHEWRGLATYPSSWGDYPINAVLVFASKKTLGAMGLSDMEVHAIPPRSPPAPFLPDQHCPGANTNTVFGSSQASPQMRMFSYDASKASFIFHHLQCREENATTRPPNKVDRLVAPHERGKIAMRILTCMIT